MVRKILSFFHVLIIVIEITDSDSLWNFAQVIVHNLRTCYNHHYSMCAQTLKIHLWNQLLLMFVFSFPNWDWRHLVFEEVRGHWFTLCFIGNSFKIMLQLFSSASSHHTLLIYFHNFKGIFDFARFVKLSLSLLVLILFLISNF